MPQLEAPCGMIWELRTDLHPYSTHELWNMLGLIPYFLDASDERPAVKQFEARYGCFPMFWPEYDHFTLDEDGVTLHYTGDPSMLPFATTELHGERVLVYEFGWTCVVHANGSIEVARID